MATADSDDIVGRWKNGRIGDGARQSSSRRGERWSSAGRRAVQSDSTMKESYRPVLQQIVKFFQTGTPPVAPDEALEMIAFRDAAQRSKEDADGRRAYADIARARQMKTGI